MRTTLKLDEDVARQLAALARRYEVAHGGHRQRHQAARGRALDGAHHDQHRDVLGRAAERRSCDEGHERDLEQPLPPVPVAEFPPERGGRRGGDHVGRYQPRDVGEPSQVRRDRGQGGRQDRLVEHRRQHRQDNRRERDGDIRETAMTELRAKESHENHLLGLQ